MNYACFRLPTYYDYLRVAQSNYIGFLMGFDSACLIRFIFSLFFETATNQKYFQSVMNIDDGQPGPL